MISVFIVGLPLFHYHDTTISGKMHTQPSLYIETYGCQMNMADTEVVLRIMQNAGYIRTDDLTQADVVLVNTCAVRDNAEQRIIGRLGDFYHQKKKNLKLIIGVLGCMAKRVRRDLMASAEYIDLVVGPDEYRKLPDLIDEAHEGTKGLAVQLSREETYDDIAPVRTDGLSAWISIMRGCNNFCTYCVVPFTRGRERSRPLRSIVQEVEEAGRNGFKEVTLLGQNVNSYADNGNGFAELLTAAADVDPNIRVRFMTSHPQDMSLKIIEAIASRKNICKSIHLPFQSGSDRILKRMNRSYTADQYLDCIRLVKTHLPDVSLSTDIIAGFPTETESDHKKTLDILRKVEFDGAYTFQYSPRENTKAWHMGDDVPDAVKQQRLGEIIEFQREISLRRNNAIIGSTVEVLVEGPSKKSKADWCGRTDTNKMVVFPKNGDAVGDYVDVHIERVNSATLFGTQAAHASDQSHALIIHEG